MGDKQHTLETRLSETNIQLTAAKLGDTVKSAFTEADKVRAIRFVHHALVQYARNADQIHLDSEVGNSYKGLSPEKWSKVMISGAIMNSFPENSQLYLDLYEAAVPESD